MPPAEFYVDVVSSVVEGLGLLLTVWRVYFRLKIGRFWWEDAWAAIMLVTGITRVVSFWTITFKSGLVSIVAAWIYSMGFNCIVTLARLSVLFSIIRIIHGSPRLLIFTYACAAFFLASWLIQVVQKILQCASNPNWHPGRISWVKSFCLVNEEISIFEFTTDCISVLILVVLPLCMLWRIKLPRRQKRMILSIFASSVVLALAALYHTIGHILNVYIVMSVGFHVETALSIIVCNLLVAVTYTYRFLLHDNAGATDSTEDSPTSFDDDFTTRSRRPTPVTALSLTTVDLDVGATTGLSQPRSSAVLESS